MVYQGNKGRLLPEALYRGDLEIHNVRRAQDLNSDAGDARQHMPSAKALARRIQAIDPHGLVADAIATEVEGI